MKPPKTPDKMCITRVFKTLDNTESWEPSEVSPPIAPAYSLGRFLGCGARREREAAPGGSPSPGEGIEGLRRPRELECLGQSETLRERKPWRPAGVLPKDPAGD